MTIQTRVTVAAVVLMGASVMMAWTMYRGILDLKDELVRLKAADRRTELSSVTRTPELIELKQRLARMEQRSQKVLTSMAVVAVAVPTISMGVVVFLLVSTFRRVDVQLAAIHRGAEAFAKGQLDSRVLELTGDELGELAVTLNRMMVELREVTVARCDLDEAKERLARTQTQLDQAQRLKEVGRLTGGISHDLNNILSVIREAVGSAREREARGDPASEDLDSIDRSVRQAVNLIRQVFYPGRPEATCGPTDLNAKINSLSDLLRRSLKPRVELRFELDPGLVPVRIDPTHVEQILLNLVVNARDAMPGGGVLSIATRTVTLPEPSASGKAEPAAKEYALLEVKDTGTGIAADVMPRIFDPFFTTKGVGKGTGLGLAICQGVVQRAEGTISVDSSPGHGTCFSIHLPTATSGHRDSTTPSSAVIQERGHGTVLVGEDEPAVRRQTSRILRERGYTVLEADGGSEAVSLLDDPSTKIDLVLVAISKPPPDGWRQVERVRKLRPEVRFLILSDSAPDALNTPSDIPFLEKPFLAEQLARAVRAALEGATGLCSPLEAKD